jgi:hypothetical protein
VGQCRGETAGIGDPLLSFDTRSLTGQMFISINHRDWKCFDEFLYLLSFYIATPPCHLIVDFPPVNDAHEEGAGGFGGFLKKFDHLFKSGFLLKVA